MNALALLIPLSKVVKTDILCWVF